MSYLFPSMNMKLHAKNFIPKNLQAFLSEPAGIVDFVSDNILYNFVFFPPQVLLAAAVCNRTGKGK